MLKAEIDWTDMPRELSRCKVYEPLDVEDLSPTFREPLTNINLNSSITIQMSPQCLTRLSILSPESK